MVRVGCLASWPPTHPIPTLDPQVSGHGSHQFLNRALAMKVERFAGEHEARDASVLSIAGVAAIMGLRLGPGLSGERTGSLFIGTLTSKILNDVNHS